MVDLEKFRPGLGCIRMQYRFISFCQMKFKATLGCHFTESFILMKRKACKECIRILHV